MQIKIDTDIPVPSHDIYRPKYPWAEMSVGESFAVPSTSKIRSFRQQAVAAGRIFGRKFSVRSCEDGYRCWRVA